MSADPVRVFLTGATGFIGSALSRALAARGVRLDALVRPGSDRSHLADLNIVWHEGDITEGANLKEMLSGANWVIHAAGRLGDAGVSEKTYRQLHVDGTRNIMQAALEAGTVERFLHISSPGVLGPICGEPATEDQAHAPINPYERTKAAAEKVALDFFNHGLPVIIVRPEFVYGPGDRHVLRLFQAVQQRRFFHIDGGRHLCHPTFIGDAVDGMLLCLESGRPGEVYHIAGPGPVTFRDLSETIAAAIGVRPPQFGLPSWGAVIAATIIEAIARIGGLKPRLTRSAVDFFRNDRAFSWEKAHTELGYTPQYDLAAGIGTTVEWYRKNKLL